MSKPLWSTLPSLLLSSFALLGFFSPVSLAQVGGPPQVEWERAFGGVDNDWGAHAEPTSDGGFIVCGATRSSGAGDFDVYLIKTDSDGNVLWERTFGGSDRDEGEAVTETSDGGYVVAGLTRSFGATDRGRYASDVYLLKTDRAGNLLREKTFAGERARSLQEVSDGGLIVAGLILTDGGDPHFYLLRTDSDGNRVWEKTLGGNQANSVEETSDGGFILAGSIGVVPVDADNDTYVIKTDSSGEELWHTRLGGRGHEGGSYPPEVHQTPDGGYVIAGASGSFGQGDWDVYLVKLDAGGGLVWQETYGGRGDEVGTSFQITPDGGYLVAGSRPEEKQLFLLKTDPTGNLLWQESVSTVAATPESLRSTANGGYVVAGFTDSLGPQGERWNVYLAKLGTLARRFRRGDCDGDGRVEGQITDAIFLLNYNFRGGRRPPCLAACDANGDGRVEGEVTDAVYLLIWNFRGGPAPVEPFAECGSGTAEDDALGCATVPESCR